MKLFLLGLLMLSFYSVASASNLKNDEHYSCEHQRKLAELNDRSLFGATVKERVTVDFNQFRTYDKNEVTVYQNDIVFEKKEIIKVANCTLNRSLTGTGYACSMGYYHMCQSYELITDGYVFKTNERVLAGELIDSDITLATVTTKVYDQARAALKNCLCE
jgi:hypothetical protein